MDIVKVNVAGQCSRFYTTAAMVGGYNVKYKSVRVPQLPQRWWKWQYFVALFTRVGKEPSRGFTVPGEAPY